MKHDSQGFLFIGTADEAAKLLADLERVLGAAPETALTAKLFELRRHLAQMAQGA